MPTVRTRFAPSPTGYMHIGGMRTALFNWLWARHTGGQFILRIDDTDRQRNLDAALGPILHAFRWLGLDWDEGPEIGGPLGPYFQSERTDLYREEIKKLFNAGKAYKDFDPPEVTQADREAAEKEKRPFLNVRRSLDLSPQQVEQYEAEGKPYVIRLLIDRSRQVSLDDHIRGHVVWDCGLIPDPVIMRANGSPLYNFASVIDDARMRITHVIRAEEHLTNTAVQVLLFEALGYPLPEFAHIPFVAAPGTKEKLSKRDKKLEQYRKSPQFKRLFDIADAVLPRIGLEHSESLNPVMVSFYEAVGFLPEAVLNGLARLGWSFDDKTENMSREFLVEHFTLERVVKAPAGLDPDKLLAYQEHWMGQLSLEEKIDRCRPYLVRAKLVQQPASSESPDVGDDVSTQTDKFFPRLESDSSGRSRLVPPHPQTKQFLRRLITALGDRLKLFSDILNYEEYFVADEDLVYDEKAFEKRIRKPERAVDLLQKYRDVLAAVPESDFNAASLETQFKSWLEQEGITFGDVIHALRVAVTGKPAGPGMFDCLELLGRQRCLTRIDQAIDRARQP
jgi:glutamyl-tRNA synthetase